MSGEPEEFRTYRRRDLRPVIQVFVVLVAILAGIFLMVGDEVIGFINPSRQLEMNWPLGLKFTAWQSWEIVFVVILACMIFYIVLIEYLM